MSSGSWYTVRMISNKTFSGRLRDIRKKKGLSQGDLARKSGLSPRMIGHYETRVTYPPIEKIEILAKALNVSIADLLGLHERGVSNADHEFDVRVRKRFRKILYLTPKDRSAVYKYVDNLLKGDEYKSVRSEIEELNS